MTPMNNPLEQRRSGVLLHPTSLPGPWIMGDFSHNAYRFVEFLAAAGQTVWQVLPLGPTHGDLSPYQCMSTHAGNPLLISLDWMVDKGWLDGNIWERAEDRIEWRQDVLARGCDSALSSLSGPMKNRFEQFQQTESGWLDDYAQYIVIKQLEQGAAWMDWPRELRRHSNTAIEKALRHSTDQVRRCKFEQFIFYTQWLELRQYANQHGVNNRLQVNQFGWWLDRIRTHFNLYDLVRIDHFRGLESYWEIPASSPTAIKGKWVEAPGAALLGEIAKKHGELPLVAEDLGIITVAVDRLREDFDLPGMKVLQFAFDGDPDNHHLPHNHSKDMVAYTGTHDNDTTVSWYQSLSADDKHQVRRYLNCSDDDMPWALVRSAMMSVAQLAIIPMQDLLSLGEGHRMNTPGTVAGNWSWRFDWSQLSDNLASELADLTHNYSRYPSSEKAQSMADAG